MSFVHIMHTYLAGHRNKSNENHYPSFGIAIVVQDTSIPAQAKLACHVVMMSGVGLKSAQRKRLIHSANKICRALTGGLYMMNANAGTNISQNLSRFLFYLAPKIILFVFLVLPAKQHRVCIKIESRDQS